MCKVIKKIHGDFDEIIPNERSYNMQVKGKGKMATKETFLKEHKSTLREHSAHTQKNSFKTQSNI